MAKFVAPPPREGNFFKKLRFLYINRAAALCVVALVVFFSSCHRPALSATEGGKWVLTLDSLPEYLDLAYNHDDPRACYLVAGAIHMQATSGDTLPYIAGLNLYDAQHLLMHAADLGFRPAIETIVCLLDSNKLHLSQRDEEYWRNQMKK